MPLARPDAIGNNAASVIAARAQALRPYVLLNEIFSLMQIVMQS
jgi:hypothetical protein